MSRIDKAGRFTGLKYLVKS